MKEVCIDCDVPIEMMEPTLENPEARFECPKCGMKYGRIEVMSEKELELN